MGDIFTTWQLHNIQRELEQTRQLLKEKDLRERRAEQEQKADTQKTPPPAPAAPAKFNLLMFKNGVAKLKAANNPLDLPQLEELLGGLNYACDRHACDITPYLEREIEKVRAEGQALRQAWVPLFADLSQKRIAQNLRDQKERKTRRADELLSKLSGAGKAVAANRQVPAPPSDKEYWPGLLKAYLIFTSVVPIDTFFVSAELSRHVGGGALVFFVIWLGKIIFGGLLIRWGKKTSAARIKARFARFYDKKAAIYNAHGASLDYIHAIPSGLAGYLEDLRREARKAGLV